MHRVCALDLAVKVHLFVVNKKYQHAFATRQLDILSMIHIEHETHTRHDRCIAFLFKLNNLETKLQHMLALEWPSALG